MEIRINAINYNGSLVDGPGLRTVVFLQGCNIKCNGCHNEITWDENCGILRDVNELANELILNVKNKKITISGGEPLFQEKAVLELVRLLKGMDICLYTGSNLEEVPKEILPFLRYIKVGKYKKELKCSTKPYIGSTNQKFIDLLNDKIL